MLGLHSVLAALALLVSGQQPSTSNPQQGQVQVPSTTVTVVAQKEPADASTLPVSVTAIPDPILLAAGVTFISDAALFSPNTHFTEFTARKLSNPRIRGIGASPANPGVTTYVDGVPQFNSNTTSFDLIGVEQVEFVRGPQSALFGRNALGGVINITSERPSLSEWNGMLVVPFGSDDLVDVRATASGPLVSNRLAAGFAFAFGRRDGFTVNTLTGNDIDSREGFLGRGQLLWTPGGAWEARVIVTGERARDGDYALADLEQVRATPFEVQRDFEGRTERDILSTTAEARYRGSRFTFTSTTGVMRWKTFDATDLDYTPLPLATRENTEEALQFTEEVRLASPSGTPIALTNRVGLRWQAGALVYTQQFDQDAVNSLAPGVFNPQVPVAVEHVAPFASLDDTGLGLYGQGTLTFGSRLDVTAGARFDREQRDASIRTEFIPVVPAIILDESRTFTDVSPQLAAAFRVQERTMIYGTAARSFKAGGFNPLSIPGSEVFDEEHAWNVEGGLKTSTGDGRLSFSAAVFSIVWDDLQLNLPIPGAPAQFFIDNVGSATSRGVELEVHARPHASFDVFASLGITRARFDDGTESGGVDVSDNTIPNTPSYTGLVGAQYSRDVRGHRVWGRVDVGLTGAFEYDEANTVRQDAYALTNVRAGINFSRLIVEGWVRNAFDTRYVPLAFFFPGAASGFLAEPGRPRAFGVSVGVRY
jgi:iron complex outermembrane receptor protein